MKLAGKTQAPLNTEIVVFPRPSKRVTKQDPVTKQTYEEEVSEDLAFTVAAVLNWDSMDAVLTEPEPPRRFRPGDTVGEPVLDDEEYLKAQLFYSVARQNWLILESLKATKDLEWSTVIENQPKTWGNFRNEFKEFGLTPTEIGMILSAVYRVNSLNDRTLAAARERFLAMNPPQS